MNNLVKNLEATIVEATENGWHNSIENRPKFRELSGVEEYITDDAENYYHVDQYVNLLLNIAVLTSKNVKISEVEGEATSDSWVIKFNCSGQNFRIELFDINTDWFKEEFLAELNDCLENVGCEKKVCLVCVDSIIYTDQCFSLCFISDETYSILQNSNPAFVKGRTRTIDCFNKESVNFTFKGILDVFLSHQVGKCNIIINKRGLKIDYCWFFDDQNLGIKKEFEDLVCSFSCDLPEGEYFFSANSTEFRFSSMSGNKEENNSFLKVTESYSNDKIPKDLTINSQYLFLCANGVKELDSISVEILDDGRNRIVKETESKITILNNKNPLNHYLIRFFEGSKPGRYFIVVKDNHSISFTYSEYYHDCTPEYPFAEALFAKLGWTQEVKKKEIEWEPDSDIVD